MKSKRILSAFIALSVICGTVQTVNKYSFTMTNAVAEGNGEADAISDKLLFDVYSDHAIVTGTEDEDITECVIPSTFAGVPVTEIDNYAFDGCRKLTRVTIPESVTSIGICAFRETTWLEQKMKESPLVIVNGLLIDSDDEQCSGEIIIPEGVTHIGNSVFCFNNEIESVIIPDSVTSIAYHAFYGCENLSSVIIPESVRIIEEKAFEYTAWLEEMEKRTLLS